MRTKIKSKEHFDDYIERQPKRIERFDQKIKDGKVADNNLMSVYRKQFMISLNTFVAMYSRGDDVGEIKKIFLSVIAKMQKGWKDDKEIPADKYLFDDYVLMLFMLSIGVLLDIDKDEFAKIVAVLDESRRKDKLLEYIIAAKITNRAIVNELMYEKTYQDLIEITKEVDATKASARMKEFLEKKWYIGMRNVYWYDNHKSKHDTFFGYWSFEAAAVAKIMNVNKTEMEQNAYFPADIY